MNVSLQWEVKRRDRLILKRGLSFVVTVVCPQQLFYAVFPFRGWLPLGVRVVLKVLP